MKYILNKIVILFLFTTGSLAQVSTVHIQGYGSTDFSTSFMRFSDSESNANTIIGTPYINKDWMFGELVLDGDLSIETMFRYNLEAQNIELIYDADTLIFLHPLKMKEFNFMGRKFIYDISLGSDRRGKYIEAAYLEVVVDGYTQLLRKFEKFRSGSFSGLNYGAAGTSTESYQMRTILYVRPSPMEAPVRINRINKSVIKMLPGNKSDLDTYINNNSLNIKSLNALIQIIEYYNSLKNLD